MKGIYPSLCINNQAEAAALFYVVQMALEELMRDQEKSDGTMKAQLQMGKCEVQGSKNATAT